MTAPGVTVTVSNAPAPSANPGNTGTYFLAGASQRGPVGVPIEIDSMSDFATKLGARISTSLAYDCADIFFREGGSRILFSRYTGPAAAKATLTLLDRAGSPLSTLRVDATPGTDGNNIKVSVANGSVTNTFVISVLYNNVVVETSTLCGAPADAAAWSTKSNYVTITDLGSATAAPNNNPAVLSATALTGGTDDTSNITDTQKTNAVAVFTADLGPGQISVSGSTSATVHAAVYVNAIANNRVALLDGPDTATAATITALAATDQAAATDASYGTMLAPWVTYPPVATGTAVIPPPRTVPPSACVAALMARNDGVNDANRAAAAQNGLLTQALGVTRTYVDSDLDTLNTAGVCVIRNIPAANGVQLYGYRSLSLDPNWSDLANVRFRMQLVYEGQAIGQGFMFAQVDGQGHTIAAFNGALAANLATHWAAGSLYGATSDQAFAVNTDSTVNTPTTIANRELHAVQSVKMSPSAEHVFETIVRFPITTPLAA